MAKSLPISLFPYVFLIFSLRLSLVFFFSFFLFQKQQNGGRDDFSLSMSIFIFPRTDILFPLLHRPQTHTHKYTHAHTNKHTHTHTYTHTHTRTRTRTRTLTHTHPQTSTHIWESPDCPVCLWRKQTFRLVLKVFLSIAHKDKCHTKSKCKMLCKKRKLAENINPLALNRYQCHV